MSCEAQMAWKCLFTRTSLGEGAILKHGVGETDLVFSVGWRFISKSVHARLHYKCLCAAVTICVSPVNIQTHTQTALWPAYMNSSASWANKMEDISSSSSSDKNVEWKTQTSHNFSVQINVCNINVRVWYNSKKCTETDNWKWTIK